MEFTKNMRFTEAMKFAKFAKIKTAALAVALALFALILPALAACAEEAAGQTLTFPASDSGKTEFNASVYEITPFDVSLALPDGWTLKEREAAAENDANIALQGVWSVLDIYNAGGEHAGAVGYNTYEPYTGAEEDPRAIYGQIALGNNYHFDVRDTYTAIKETDSGVTATAGVYYGAGMNDGAEKNNKGVLSYNNRLSVYIAIEFAGDKITDEQLNAVAESIEFI